jgi:hypothetical protein
MAVRATLRRPRHPRAISAADKIADCGHKLVIDHADFR